MSAWGRRKNTAPEGLREVGREAPSESVGSRPEIVQDKESREARRETRDGLSRQTREGQLEDLYKRRQAEAPTEGEYDLSQPEGRRKVMSEAAEAVVESLALSNPRYINNNEKKAAREARAQAEKMVVQLVKGRRMNADDAALAIMLAEKNEAIEFLYKHWSQKRASRFTLFGRKAA